MSLSAHGPAGPVISWAQQFPEYEPVPPSGQRPGPERNKGPRLGLFPRPSGRSINRLDSEPGLGGWGVKRAGSAAQGSQRGPGYSPALLQQGSNK